MRLLLISNSTNPGEPFLDYPKHEIRKFLGDKPVKVLFIPYAAVTFSWDQYEARVAERYGEIGHKIISVHKCPDPVKAVDNAEAIAVGGGNTWQLVDRLHRNGLIDPIREKVLSGTPYMGWSAGSNVACPTIMTTNDMPIVEPPSFRAFNLVPFQINPHYLDANPAAMPGDEGTAHIGVYRGQPHNHGCRSARRHHAAGKREKDVAYRSPPSRIFKKGEAAAELSSKDDLSYLLA